MTTSDDCIVWPHGRATLNFRLYVPDSPHVHLSWAGTQKIHGSSGESVPETQETRSKRSTGASSLILPVGYAGRSFLRMVEVSTQRNAPTEKRHRYSFPYLALRRKPGKYEFLFSDSSQWVPRPVLLPENRGSSRRKHANREEEAVLPS